MGSNPVGVTKNTRYTSVYRVFFMTPRDEPAAVNDEERVKTEKETERREARQVRGGEATKGSEAYCPPVGVAKQVKGEPVSDRRRIRLCF